MVKKTIIAAILPMVIITTAFAAKNDVTVEFEGRKVEFENALPFIDNNNRVQIPVREICEIAGMNVSWDADTKTVSVYSENAYCNFVIGNPKAIVVLKSDGVEERSVINMDTDAIIVNDYTYIPATYLARAFSMTADWNENTHTISIRQITDADLSEHFPNDAFIAKKYFANGYADDDIPEKLVKALSKAEITDSEKAEDSIDLSDGVYTQRFSINKDESWAETKPFMNCENLAVNVTVDCEPVWITVEIAQIAENGKITYRRRLWHENAVDKSVTVDFNNLNPSAKYFVCIYYSDNYTPNINGFEGKLSAAAY